VISLLALALSTLPPHNPNWQPTYNMSMSTISMQCNTSGFSNSTRGAEFGIISYDWSNAKAEWAKAKPMDCNERLAEQARMTKSKNKNSHVFTYRNVVKALPWFKEVREKLDDPAYSGFFLKFKPKPSSLNSEFSDISDTHVPRCAREDQTKCSRFYHDQLQTPEVPTPDDPNPDGSCDGYCDCGSQPCGEYLFDHRNGTMLLEFLINEHIGGEFGLDNPNIDGFFMDDYWCSDIEQQQKGLDACRNPAQGPSEVDKFNQEDMGLSDEDVLDITKAWNSNMEAIERRILDLGKYTWYLMAGEDGAGATPIILQREYCQEMLEEGCDAGKFDDVEENENTQILRGNNFEVREILTKTKKNKKYNNFQDFSYLFGIKVNGTQILQLNEDVAHFLLVRGDYAWLGWGVWGMTWPFNAAEGFPYGVPRPELLDTDFGVPTEKCQQVEKGIFKREWTKASITLNCNTFQADIKMKMKEEKEVKEGELKFLEQ